MTINIQDGLLQLWNTTGLKNFIDSAQTVGHIQDMSMFESILNGYGHIIMILIC